MKKILGGASAIIANFFLLSAAHAVTISMNIPGTSPNASSTPGAFVSNFYQFALMIGGVLAFGIIVYGGVRYMASAGNPSGQGDAKEWIQAALLGLLLLVGAYFILNVVNPQLTSLGLPTLPTVSVTSSTSAPNCGGGSSDATCTCTSPLVRNQTQAAVNGGAIPSYYCSSTQAPVSANPNPAVYTCNGTTNGTCPSGTNCDPTNWTGPTGVITKMYYCGQ